MIKKNHVSLLIAYDENNPTIITRKFHIKSLLLIKKYSLQLYDLVVFKPRWIDGNRPMVVIIESFLFRHRLKSLQYSAF